MKYCHEIWLRSLESFHYNEVSQKYKRLWWNALETHTWPTGKGTKTVQKTREIAEITLFGIVIGKRGHGDTGDF